MDPILMVGGIMAATIALLIALLIGQTKKAARATALLKLAEKAIEAYQKGDNVRADSILTDDEWLHANPSD